MSKFNTIIQYIFVFFNIENIIVISYNVSMKLLFMLSAAVIPRGITAAGSAREKLCYRQEL